MKLKLNTIQVLRLKMKTIVDSQEFRDILVQGEVLPSANEAKSE